MNSPLADVFNYPHVCPAEGPRAFTNAYRWHREQGKTATAALAAAREDVTAGKSRYPLGGRRPGEKIAKAYGGIGAAFDVGSTRCNWYERPDDHFRRVGYADEVANGRVVDHRGWYLYPDGDPSETARGVVFRLNHGRGLLAGIVTSYDKKAAVIARDIIPIDDGDDDAAIREAARDADGIAEIYAERERDYQEASQARFKHDELGEDVKRSRKEALALFAEIRDLRKNLCGHPNVIAALRASVESLVESISDARRERGELAANFGRCAGWQDA